jgi:hypothetical protein
MDRRTNLGSSWRSSRRWRPWIPPLIGIVATLVGLIGPVRPPVALAAYQATADANVTAFGPVCLGWSDPHPARMLTLAVNGMAALGYSVTGYKGAAFTRAHTLSRTTGDWAYYVHSHGDYYLNSDTKRYSGFREDAGVCSGSVVFSKDIAAKRAGRATNLVVISTCHNGDSNTTLPGAFGIVKSKTGGQPGYGTTFYVGYLGEAFDNDEETFETAFWDALRQGKGVGPAFDLAMLGSFTHADFGADWWGSYSWSGRAGPGGICPNCA